jgi:hypothetical protein
LEDTYSHSTGKGDRNWKYHDELHAGHAVEGHLPDWTWKDTPKADKMAEEVYKQLKNLGSACGKSCPAEPYSAFSKTIHKFNDWDKAKLVLEYPGIHTVTFESYNTKIKFLDPLFQLDNYYRNLFP